MPKKNQFEKNNNLRKGTKLNKKKTSNRITETKIFGGLQIKGKCFLMDCQKFFFY